MRWTRGHRSDSKIEQLRGLPLLRACPDGEIERLASAGDLVTLPVGTTLQRGGDDVAWVYLVLDGDVAGRRGRGTFVGETEVLGCTPAQTSVAATTEVRALVFGRREFLASLDTCPSFRATVMTSLAQRLSAVEVDLPATAGVVYHLPVRAATLGAASTPLRRRSTDASQPAGVSPTLVPTH